MPQPSADGPRYVPGAEIGRGGLGRVVEAQDVAIGRTVALKLLLDGAPLEVLERFRNEGRLTGRLEHPGIVPVHDVGVLPGGGGRPAEVFIAMKRVSGRDMGSVIGALRRGLETAGWTQRRLVEALRTVCRAVAYAHSRGVIHRDLKPSNILLGEFGEVLVADWGLAKERGTGERGKGEQRRAAAGVALTLDGDVMGTPEYMPPEQAAGNQDEVDERSDVYSLGAILYEILCGRPPFTGRSADEVVSRVLSDAPQRPSLVAARHVRPDPERAATGSAPEVPAELESVCLRALARRREDRFPSASALADELTAWLEGTRERERREAAAAGLVAAAREGLAAGRACAAEAAGRHARALELARGRKPWEPIESKDDILAALDGAREAERAAARAAAEAGAALASALSNVPDHVEARNLLAGLHWDRFLAAERAGNVVEMALNRQLAERHNAGGLDAVLAGEGRVTVLARAFPCACLREVREVRPEDLRVLGYHPWSGRRWDGTPNAHLPELEPAGPVRLRVHSASCLPAPVRGARVWAWKYEEIGKRLLPVTPAEGKEAAPRELLDAAFGTSPFRPRGGGVLLGRTPFAPRPLPFGSWLLLVDADGFAPLRIPLRLDRGETAELDATLFTPAEIPAGFLPVAASRFVYQGDPADPHAFPASVRRLEEFFASRFPVSCAEYARHLASLPHAEAAARTPRAGARLLWPRNPVTVPTAAWIAAASDSARLEAARLPSVEADWREDWPVVSLSWADAAALARAASAREGFLFTIPHELQWEKAARGADARAFPWGDFPAYAFAATALSHAEGMRPAPLDAFPADESPFGLRHTAGNVSEWCLNEAERSYAHMRLLRGGFYGSVAFEARCTRRTCNGIHVALGSQGIRLAGVVRLSAGEDAPAPAAHDRLREL